MSLPLWTLIRENFSMSSSIVMTDDTTKNSKFPKNPAALEIFLERVAVFQIQDSQIGRDVIPCF